MTNLLNLPEEILNKINDYVIESKNKDRLTLFFDEWKEQVIYYSNGKKYITI